MKMRALRSILVGCTLLILAGCAVNPTVQMKPEFWAQKDRVLVVALSDLPKADYYMSGSQGLLDIAISQSVSNELDEYLESVDISDYEGAQGEIAQKLQDRGFTIKELDRTINTESLKEFESPSDGRTYADKDFRSLRTELAADRIVLLTVEAVGTQRSYYGFVPTGRPVAILRARGEIVDLTSNEVLWRNSDVVTVEIDEPWDQPPEYQNVGAAVNKVIVLARDSMMHSLFGSDEVAGR
jgi:hypothetical protein